MDLQQTDPERRLTADQVVNHIEEIPEGLIHLKRSAEGEREGRRGSESRRIAEVHNNQRN